MRITGSFEVARLACIVGIRLVVIGLVVGMTSPPVHAEDVDPELARHRNLARAHFQNEHYAKAAVEYRMCIELAPQSLVDYLNLSVSEIQAHEDESARDHLEVARALGNEYPHVFYLQGMAHLRLGESAQAEEAYGQLLAIDPICVPALYGRGMALERLDRADEAIASWRRAIELEPDHGPSYYQLFRAYTRRSERELAEVAFAEFVRIKDAGLGPGTSRSKVDASRYLDLIDEGIAPSDGNDEGGAVSVTLTDASADWGISSLVATPGAPFALDDLDDDGLPDLLLDRAAHRNDGQGFVQAPMARLSATEGPGFADLGDYDNDEHFDAVVVAGELVLYRGDGATLVPMPPDSTAVTPELPPGFAPRDLVLVDIDHEGDLDILLAGRSGMVRVLRNNGNGTFLDISAATALVHKGADLVSLVRSDLEADHDIDFFLADAQGRHSLYVNLRDGSFRDEIEASGLSAAGPASFALASDVDNNGAPDLVLVGGAGRPVEVWLNGGGARFHLDRASPVVARETTEPDLETASLVDLDNDGDLDLLLAGDRLLLYRNDGAGGWSRWLEPVEPLANSLGQEGARVRAIAAKDVDKDGDRDLVLTLDDGSVRLLRNDGGAANHHVRVRLFGRKNNLDGYGSKVWTRDGNFFQVRESFERWVDLGVGPRDRLDVLGLRWPTGVNQNLLDEPVDGGKAVEIVERPGLSESCPFVYTFDGERFVFISDVLDNTPLGVSLAPGVPFVANHREGLLIEGERLVQKDHRLSIRFTQELDEITYLDRLRLIAVDHPEKAVVVSNDRFSGAPFAPAGIHVIDSPYPPASAVDGAGIDVTDALQRADRIYADNCDPVRRNYPGITALKTLVLDPGASPRSLFLRGSTLWPEASVNMAVAQNPDIYVQGVALDVVGPDGAWVRAVDDLGLPAGMDKILPVELDDVFLSDDHRVRVSASIAVVWDQAFFSSQSIREGEAGTRISSAGSSTVQTVAGEAHGPAATTTELRPMRADLRYRGFSEIFSPDDKLPDLYDYHELMEEPAFEIAHVGRYTRFGNVIELIDAIDDRFVVLAPGDEVAVEFPAIGLPDLPEGWRRDWILEVEGWIKDGDLRTVTSDAVAPLPFHGMLGYPYGPAVENPDDPLHAPYLREYQTRILPTRPVSAKYP